MALRSPSADGFKIRAYVLFVDGESTTTEAVVIFPAINRPSIDDEEMTDAESRLDNTMALEPFQYLILK